jgi:hypothetical protein
MGKFNHHSGVTQTPKHILTMVDSGVPHNKTPAKQGTHVPDENMLGAHTNDHVVLHNAHPHMEHSVGYDGDTSYTNHGFEASHVSHGARDKGPEHHPPSGLYDGIG